MSQPGLAALAAASLRIGCLGFGGPAGQIALMHRVFVDEKNWIDEARFQHALSFCMLLPGPEAQQLATYIGWRLQGARGAVIAGWLFVIPGALVVLALSWFYAAYGALPHIAAIFDGIKCAVVALVAQALLKVGARAMKTRLAVAVAVATFVALLFGAPFPAVIVAAGVLGYMLAPPRGDALSAPVVEEKGTLRHAALWLALWAAPLAFAAALLGPDHLLFEIGLFFSMLAVVTFGGAYALLSYLATEATAHGWLTARQMIDGLGLAETTPGPLILVNQFIGFLAGWPTGPLMAVAAAAMATWCTFAPSFVWIFAAAPWAERLRADPRASGALALISAAVLGVIAKLALFFTAVALFRAQVTVAGVALPDLASARLWMVALALVSGLALIRFKAPVLPVLAACAALGWAAGQAGWR